MTGSLTLPSGSSAYNDTCLKFATGSRIGENTSGGLGIYGYERIYMRPSATTASGTEGIEISNTGLIPTNNNTITRITR